MAVDGNSKLKILKKSDAMETNTNDPLYMSGVPTSSTGRGLDTRGNHIQSDNNVHIIPINFCNNICTLIVTLKICLICSIVCRLHSSDQCGNTTASQEECAHQCRTYFGRRYSKRMSRQLIDVFDTIIIVIQLYYLAAFVK